MHALSKEIEHMYK